MKKILTFALLTVCSAFALQACAQGSPNDTPEQKLKRASPPAEAKVTTNSGVTITIEYSQPALKGRTIGKDVEPMDGKVWRTGANEATSFEVSKDVMVNGQKLPAGKYGLYTISGPSSWTIIFNKTWKTWGAFSYKQADDVLRVNATPSTASTSMERFTITADKDGTVTLHWGKVAVPFKVQ